MKGPTKQWKFEEIYSIVKVRSEHKVIFKLLIDWTCGQSLYDRAGLNLMKFITEIEAEGWTASDCQHCSIGVEQGLTTAAVANQFVDHRDAYKFALDCYDRLKEISGMAN